MSEPAPQVDRGPQLGGRALVVAFVVAMGVVLAVALGLRYANRTRIRVAQDKTMPALFAKVSVVCESARGSFELKRYGQCPSGSTLLLTASKPGTGTRSLDVALLGPQPVVQPLPFDRPVRLPLAGTGPRFLALILANGAVDPTPLRRTLQAHAKADVREQMTDAEAFVSRLIARGTGARVERFPFQAAPEEAAPAR